MRLTMYSLAAVAFAAASLVSIPATHAQTQSPAPGVSRPAPNISDQKLDATAAAIQRVSSLKQDYQQKIATAPPADKKRIADEANDALVKAVTDQGLSVDEYNSIVEVAQSDPEVHRKLVQRLRPSGQ